MVLCLSALAFHMHVAAHRQSETLQLKAQDFIKPIGPIMYQVDKPLRMTRWQETLQLAFQSLICSIDGSSIFIRDISNFLRVAKSERLITCGSSTTEYRTANHFANRLIREAARVAKCHCHKGDCTGRTAQEGQGLPVQNLARNRQDSAYIMWYQIFWKC